MGMRHQASLLALTHLWMADTAKPWGQALRPMYDASKQQRGLHLHVRVMVSKMMSASPGRGQMGSSCTIQAIMQLLIQLAC